MAGPRSRSLIPWAIRSHRGGVLSLGLGFGVLIAIMAPAYVAAARAISGGLAALAADAQPVAMSFRFLTGPVERLDTVGGYLSYKVFPDVALLLAVYAAIQGAQVIRGSEGRGILDLWLATARTRSAIMRDRIVGFLTALSIIIGCIFVGTVIGGLLASVQIVLPAAGQCVAVGLVALPAFALGLLLAQFVQTARAAAALSAAFLVASFFVANMYNQLGALTFLRYVSPFYYYLHARTLVEGIAFDIPSMAVLAAAALLCGSTAWFVFQRRDVGGVALGRIGRTRVVDHTFHPSMVWRRSLWLNSIAEQPVGVVSWVLGIAAFTTAEAAVVPSAITIVNDRSSTFKTFLTNHGGLLTTDQYLSYVLSFTALLVAGFVISQVARWTDDASQHRNDVVLAYPVAMWRLLVERVAALLVLAALAGVAVVVGTLAGTLIGGYSADGGGLARTLLDIVLFALALGGVGILATAIFRSSVATGVTGGILVACFFLTTVAGLMSWPSWTSWPSVFDAFGAPYLSMPRTGSLIYLAALGSGGVVAAYVAMRRGMRIAA